MDEPATPPAVPEKLFTFQDYLFLSYLAFCMFCVAWVGRMAYNEGMHNEITKRNGEQWAKWFTEASPERVKPDFALAACSTAAPPVVAPVAATPATPETAATNPASEVPSEATGGAIPVPVEPKPVEAAPPAPPVKAWGPCQQALTAKGGPLADMINPFSNQPVALVAKCDMTDRSLAGALVLEKIQNTPPGSAISTITSQLVETDPINQKMQLRITVCDKGAYPIRIAELDF